MSDLFEELEAYVANHKARTASSPLAIYHDEEYHEEQTNIEVTVPIIRHVPLSDRVSVNELPDAPLMACVIYTGGYDRMPEALNTLMV